MESYFQTLYGTFSGRCSTTVLKKFSCIRTFAEQTTRKFLKVCSGSVLEEAKVYSRTVLEQTIRTFLELFWNHSKNVLE